jgi:hypothetical protein
LRSKIAVETIDRFALKAHWMEASSVSYAIKMLAPPVKACGQLSARWRRTTAWSDKKQAKSRSTTKRAPNDERLGDARALRRSFLMVHAS